MVKCNFQEHSVNFTTDSKSPRNLRQAGFPGALLYPTYDMVRG